MTEAPSAPQLLRPPLLLLALVVGGFGFDAVLGQLLEAVGQGLGIQLFRLGLVRWRALRGAAVPHEAVAARRRVGQAVVLVERRRLSGPGVEDDGLLKNKGLAI